MRRRRGVLAAATLTLAVLGVLPSSSAASIPPAVASSTESVSVEPATPGRVVPSSFIGLGLEYRTIPAFAGNNPKAINPVLIQLVRNLDPGQRPLVRLGGQSTDRSWWPVHGIRQSPGITYSLTPRWMATTRALAQALNARFIVGINLEADNTRIAGTEARRLVKGIGPRRVDALEIGNEPELYTVTPWYNLLDGRPIPWYLKHHGTPVLSRPSGYNFTDFTADFSRFRRSMPQLPLAGPATGSFAWLTDLPRFLPSAAGLRWVTFHRYGLNGCVTDPSSPDYPTVPHLLGGHASRGIMDGVGPFIALAHQHRLKFLLDEMNSVTCNGRAGVSDTFASALWALDSMFGMVSAGVDGVNIHSFQKSLNGLFDFQQVHGRWVGVVHPVYYGMLMFARAAPPGARLLRVLGPGDPELRTWATVGRDRRIRVVLINDSLDSARSLLVRGISSGAPTLERLEAPSAYAKSGVSLGGRRFGSQTSSGKLVGRPRIDTLKPAGGAYGVRLPAATAAMLTFAPSTPGGAKRSLLRIASAG